MTTISAKTILSSQSLESDRRMTTLLLRYPRWIHSEFMTHGAISKNSASSRAIPIDKLIEEAVNDPASPLHWGKHQKGMQAYTELGGRELEEVRRAWFIARNHAVVEAKIMAGWGAAKQIVNRILEPFVHITVLASATEWNNFLALRNHHAAEPHIQLLAMHIQRELSKEPMQHLKEGDWHLPFITNEDENRYSFEECRILSTARCASTSYKTVDGFDMDMDSANRIYKSLLAEQPIHASPAEHLAQCMDTPRMSRNLKGFIPYRAFLANDTVWG